MSAHVLFFFLYILYKRRFCYDESYLYQGLIVLQTFFPYRSVACLKKEGTYS